MTRFKRATNGAARVYAVTPHHIFEMTVAVGWAIVGLAWLTQQGQIAERSPVGREVGWWSDAWSAAYLVAAVLVVYGVIRSLRARVAGLLLLGAGLAMNTVAVLTYDPDLRVLVYALHGLACATRAALLFKLAER